MADRESFVRQILAAPDDDTLVLQFADWLEEQGDPEADVIRMYLVQEKEDSRRKFGVFRSYDYMEDPFLGSDYLVGIQRRLGVVFHVEMTLVDFFAHGEFILANHPVRSLALLRIYTKGNLNSSKFLDQLTELEIPANGRFADLVISCPHLANVQALRLVGERMHGATVQKILEKGPWKQLTYLAVESSNFQSNSGASVIQALISSKSLNNIVRLDVRGPLPSELLSLMRARFGPALVIDDFQPL